MPTAVTLKLHAYRYFDYERELAQRELRAFGARRIVANGTSMTAEFAGTVPVQRLRALTYFQSFELHGGDDSEYQTLQHLLEQSRRTARSGRRQQTRYSVHCWHEYKGRFNPQVVHGILNGFFDRSALVLDPFCGSGTTLVECAHKGITAIGTDLNPFSVFLSRAKIAALRTNPAHLANSARTLLEGRQHAVPCPDRTPEQSRYLAAWFPPETLAELEAWRQTVLTELPPSHRAPFLCLISDLLRDYSLQEPSDLRIRRRYSPFPAESLRSALQRKIDTCLSSATAAAAVLGRISGTQEARLASAEYPQRFRGQKFDGIVTSPPYATALPYIDTQRLSLIWLGLIEPDSIADTEESLIGAREALKGELAELTGQLAVRVNGLPASVTGLIRSIASNHDDHDGFRRRAVPALLYRYFRRMKQCLAAMRDSVRQNGTAVLVVGTNRTTAGGKTILIPTPELLAEVGMSVGWQVREIVPLETYQRYGMHSKNAVQGESLVVLH